jgi:Tfp pilus assembly protein PilN
MSTLDDTREPPFDRPGESPAELPSFEPSSFEPPPSSPGPMAPAAPPLDRIEPLNLARRPFLNSRPVVRVSLLLWLLGLGLLLINLALFQGYLASSADKREQIARGALEVARQQQVAAELQARLDALDLKSLNDKVDFLNEKIGERTFSMSLLLDRIAEVLPHGVRLERLKPNTGEVAKRQLGRSRSVASTRERRQDGAIPLVITGEARSDEDLLRFVDNLFAHPAFADPNPKTDTRQEEQGNLLRFELTVQYIPGGTPQTGVIEEEAAIEELPSPAAGAPGTAVPGTATPAPARPPGPGGRP